MFLAEAEKISPAGGVGFDRRGRLATTRHRPGRVRRGQPVLSGTRPRRLRLSRGPCWAVRAAERMPPQARAGGVSDAVVELWRRVRKR